MSELIVLRGPSGAGKSTVAKLLHQQAVAKTALFEQDYFRHTMFNSLHTELEAPRQVMFAGMATALHNGYDVIVEGILSMGKYKPYFDQLLAEHPHNNYFFYFDVSFEETMRRHATRAKQEHFGEAQMREWYERAGPTGYANEHRIPEGSTAQQACAFIAGMVGIELRDTAEV